MTGFKNVIGGVEHFFQHVGADADEAIKEAIKLLGPSINAVAAEIKAHGPEIVQAIASASAAAIEAARAANANNSDAGKAGLAAMETAAITGAISLGGDALHAIATAQVAS